MRKRWLLLVAGSLLCLGFVGVFAWEARQPRPEITFERFQRIKVGMRAQEVEAIFGGPPGNYSGDESLDAWVTERASPSGPGAAQRELRWCTYEFWVGITFDADGKVIDTGCAGNGDPQTFWDRLRARLGW